MLELGDATELHVIATDVYPVAARSAGDKHLQWHGALHFGVVLLAHLQDVICA